MAVVQRHVSLGVPCPLSAFVQQATDNMVEHMQTRRIKDKFYAVPANKQKDKTDLSTCAAATPHMQRHWSFMDGSNMSTHKGGSTTHVTHFGWVSFMNYENLQMAIKLLSSDVTKRMAQPSMWQSDWGSCISFSRNMEDTFPLFTDMDIEDAAPWTREQYLRVIPHLQRDVMSFFDTNKLAESTMDMVTMVAVRDDGSPRTIMRDGKLVYKSGVHVYWPNLIVNAEQAMTIRTKWLITLKMRLPRGGGVQNTWEDVLDAAPYKPSSCTGLRAPFMPKISRCRKCNARNSRKCTQCLGRAFALERASYTPFACMRGMSGHTESLRMLMSDNMLEVTYDDTKYTYKESVWRTLTWANLWVPPDTELTPGFRLPAGISMWLDPKQKRPAPRAGAGVADGSDDVDSDDGGGRKRRRGRPKETAPPSSMAFIVLTSLVRMVADPIADADVEEVEVCKNRKGEVIGYYVTLEGEAARWCLNLNGYHRSVKTRYHITRDKPKFVQLCGCTHDHVRPHTGMTCSKARLEGKGAKLHGIQIPHLFNMTSRQMKNTVLHEDQVLNTMKDERMQYAELLFSQLSMMLYGKVTPPATYDTTTHRHVAAMTSMTDCNMALMTSEQLEAHNEAIAQQRKRFDDELAAVQRRAEEAEKRDDYDNADALFEQTERLRAEQQKMERQKQRAFKRKDAQRMKESMHQRIDMESRVLTQFVADVPPSHAIAATKDMRET